MAGRPLSYSDTALVLGLRDLGEADRLVFLFSGQRGRYNAVARSARRPASRLGGQLQLFALVDLHVVPRQSLDIITAARARTSEPALADNREKFSAASRVVEFLRRATGEGDPNPGLFRLATQTIGLISERERVGPQLWQFELSALDQLGVAPALDVCVHCNLQPSADNLWFDPDSGGVLCPNCAARTAPMAMSGRALRALRFLQAQPLGEGDRLRIDPALGREIGALLDLAMTAAIGRSLRSPDGGGTATFA